ncbi:MAG: ATP-binding protein [Gemmatimonadota bacterium]
MRKPASFERRLLLALVLISLVPSLLLVAFGTVLLREAVSLQTTPAGWERLAESGQVLLERAEASEDTTLHGAAARHRQELSGSVQQAQRWGYLNRRVLAVLPWFALGFFALLGLLAVRSARGIAHELARPIHDLVGWSRLVARDQPLPPPRADDASESGEFGALRQSFRGMVVELESSRARALESARIRASVALARGVAHELKNALTPLNLAVRSLRRQGALSDQERESLDVIEAESQRLDTLARAFAQFGRPPEGVPSPIDLGELLDYLARTHLPGTVERAVDVEADLPPIEGYYDPLSRAFANLLLNAAEAIGEKDGVVSISARRVGTERVEIQIADSGSGIPDDAFDRLWEPAFSTKSQGTGLGLALVRQTVEAHGGRVEAENLARGGALFRILLPLTTTGAAAALGASGSGDVL